MFDQDGNAYVGIISGIIMGGQSVQPIRGRLAETASTEGMIGYPSSEAITLRHGDRIDISGVRYSVVGQPQWDYPHHLTGTSFGYRWHKVDAVIG